MAGIPWVNACLRDDDITRSKDVILRACQVSQVQTGNPKPVRKGCLRRESGGLTCGGQ